MNKSFFDGKIASGYRLDIVSFDDDYYYGIFYRSYEHENPAKMYREHISFMKIDLDNPIQVLLDSVTEPDRQTYIDFEIDYLVEDRDYLLQEKIENIIEPQAHAIFSAVKREGLKIDLILRE
ncbi:MAG: hypothetical protein IBX56_19990 [Methylomicrobium sp.]|nr:hypothetical protein [Methylomicrobium sp.]